MSRYSLDSIPTHVGTAALGLTLLLAAPFLSASDCIPMHEASQHVDETKCIAGKVRKIKVGNKGVHFLEFGEEQMAALLL